MAIACAPQPWLIQGGGWLARLGRGLHAAKPLHSRELQSGCAKPRFVGNTVLAGRSNASTYLTRSAPLATCCQCQAGADKQPVALENLIVTGYGSKRRFDRHS